ncbi:hypothetical protein Tco_1419158 [Tanacetum coccineum]
MPIWKDPSYFDSPTENVENGEPNTANDTQKQDEDGLNNENAEQERFLVDSSLKDVNAVGQQVNTASLDINTVSLELNVVGSSVSTASPYKEDITEEEPEVDLGNITNSYIVPTTPNIRIHKDHPIDNVIGEVQSTVQTRRIDAEVADIITIGEIGLRVSAIEGQVQVMASQMGQVEDGLEQVGAQVEQGSCPAEGFIDSTAADYGF